MFTELANRRANLGQPTTPEYENWWTRLHSGPHVRRWIVKGAVFTLVVFLTLYPKPWLLPQWISRLTDLDSVLDPQNPGLAVIADDVRERTGPDPALVELIPVIEDVVTHHVPYAFDWDTWGVMDHLPTVSEVMAVGRDDCDGRAVVAASLLRRLGFRAWLVTDLRHTWVAASERDAEQPPLELMGPGERPTLAGGRPGTRVTASGLLGNTIRALAFGVAVFPLGREIILVGAAALLTMHPRSSRSRRVTGLALLLTGLLLVRAADPAAGRFADSPLRPAAGFAIGVAGWGALAWRGRGGVRADVGRSPSARPE